MDDKRHWRKYCNAMSSSSGRTFSCMYACPALDLSIINVPASDIRFAKLSLDDDDEVLRGGITSPAVNGF